MSKRKTMRFITCALLLGAAGALAPAPKARAVSLEIKVKTAAKQAGAAALAASVLFSGAPDALAARSGGRAGGRGGGGFRSAPRGGGASRSYSRGGGGGYARGGPVMAMPIGVPMYGGGFGMSPFGMGYGMSPGTMVGLSIIDSIANEQRRSSYIRQQLETQRELGKDSADIDSLTRMLTEQDAKIAELQAQVQAGKQ